MALSRFRAIKQFELISLNRRSRTLALRRAHAVARRPKVPAPTDPEPALPSTLSALRAPLRFQASSRARRVTSNSAGQFAGSNLQYRMPQSQARRYGESRRPQRRRSAACILIRVLNSSVKPGIFMREFKYKPPVVFAGFGG
jgi:hypothetical protein